jgi:DNA-binding XRE family transcriptional regulator
MPLLRIVMAPALLFEASRALGMSQAQLGAHFGVSRRTMIRWQQGRHGPSYEQWVALVGHVHTRNPAVAAAIAAELGETLLSLGLQPPPESPMTARLRAGFTVNEVVDLVVCAAAEAMAVAPQVARAGILATLDRMDALGVGTGEARAALRQARATPPGA